MQDSFFELADEQVLGEGWRPAFLESWSLQLRNDTMSPQLKSFFFHRRIYSLCFVDRGLDHQWKSQLTCNKHVDVPGALQVDRLNMRIIWDLYCSHDHDDSVGQNDTIYKTKSWFRISFVTSHQYDSSRYPKKGMLTDKRVEPPPLDKAGVQDADGFDWFRKPVVPGKRLLFRFPLEGDDVVDCVELVERQQAGVARQLLQGMGVQRVLLDRQRFEDQVPVTDACAQSQRMIRITKNGEKNKQKVEVNICDCISQNSSKEANVDNWPI